MIDFAPATEALAAVVAGVRDDQLDGPTPCAGTSVAALLDHITGFPLAFAAAARKTPLDTRSAADATHLDPDWRSVIPARLTELAKAWTDPDAWTGMTAAGGVELPGEVAAYVALDELIVHGWDLAAATGQKLAWGEEQVEAALRFVRGAVERSPDGTPGLFGPPVPASGSLLDELLGLTGRDPAWSG